MERKEIVGEMRVSVHRDVHIYNNDYNDNDVISALMNDNVL